MEKKESNMLRNTASISGIIVLMWFAYMGFNPNNISVATVRLVMCTSMYVEDAAMIIVSAPTAAEDADQEKEIIHKYPITSAISKGITAFTEAISEEYDQG